MANLTRRRLIGSTLAGSAALVAGSAVAAEVPQHWDEEFDVLVIGSGFAGLAAAYEAHKAGASVVILEKMPTAGGNSIINGGILTATGCPQQKSRRCTASRILLSCS